MTGLRWDVVVERHPGSVRFLSLFGQRPALEADPVSASVLVALAHGMEPARVREEVQRTFDGELSEDDVVAFQHTVRELALLEDATAAAERQRVFESALHDGVLHLTGRPDPSLPTRVAALLERGARTARRRLGHAPRVLGALCPHGDLENTGACSAAVYAALDERTFPDVVLVLGTSHYEPTPALLTCDVVTSGGRAFSDRELIARLRKHPAARRVALDTPAFLVEHSWQQDLPLLLARARELGRALCLVPLLVGDLSFDEGFLLGQALAELCFEGRRRGLLVASGDLTHFGARYPRQPAFPTEGASVAEVAARIAAHDATLLDAIARHDGAAFAAAVEPTSFCARSQVGALLGFTRAAHGVVVEERTVVNGKPLRRASERPFRPSDNLFRAASLAFVAGPPRASSTPLRLCDEVLLHASDQHVRLLHRCDNQLLELSADATPVLYELLAGVRSVRDLAARVSERLADDVTVDDLAPFVTELRERGLLHAPAPASVTCSPALRRRAEHDMAIARSQVPAYRDLPDRLDDAPLLSSAHVRRAPRAYLSARIDPERLSSRRYSVRTSSSSSGSRPLASVVERELMRERASAEQLVTGMSDDVRLAQVNRPANLFGDFSGEGGFRAKASSDGLRVSPGPNPTTVDDATWDRALERLARYQPEVLSGDPAYLSALARRSAWHGMTWPGLRVVDLGHGFATRLHRAIIERAFGAPTRRRYHSSELGTIAIDCPHGNLHLVEATACYEVLRQGRETSLGERGELVATTLGARARPLVRYRVGDVVRVVAPRCACGRPFRVLAVDGRVHDSFRARRALVCLEDIDAAIGAPAGVAFWQLLVRRGEARLFVVPTGDRGLLSLDDALARLQACAARPARVELRRSLRVRRGGKLLPLRVQPAFTDGLT